MKRADPTPWHALASPPWHAMAPLLLAGGLAMSPAGCKPPAKTQTKRSRALAFTHRLAQINAEAVSGLQKYNRLERAHPPDPTKQARARARVRADVRKARQAYRTVKAPFDEAIPLHRAFGAYLDAWAAFVEQGLALDEYRSKRPPPSEEETEHRRDRVKGPLKRWAAAHAALQRAQASFERKLGLPVGEGIRSPPVP